MRSIRVYNVYQCSACGGTHRMVQFLRLPEPVKINGREYTHHEICPVTGGDIYANDAGTETALRRRDATMVQRYGHR